MPVRGRGIDLDTMTLASAVASSPVSITATSSATGQTCLTTGAFTVENAGSFLVEVYAPFLTIGTTNLDVELWDSTTFLQSLSGHMAATINRPGATMITKQTLAAGGHTLIVKAFVDGGTGTFGAGAGTTGVAPNAQLLVSPA